MRAPMAVMIVSGLVWFAWAVMLPDGPIPRLASWLVDVCRILFAVAALVVLSTAVGKVAV